MSLHPEDFYEIFSEREVKKITLESMGDVDDNEIYIRSLSYAEKKRFQNGLEKIAKRLSKVADEKDLEKSKKIWKDSVQNADDYIIPASMCYSNGSLMWKGKQKEYKKFCETVPGKVIEEIMYAINDFNDLTGSFVPNSAKDEKKNEEK